MCFYVQHSEFSSGQFIYTPVPNAYQAHDHYSEAFHQLRGPNPSSLQVAYEHMWAGRRLWWIWRRTKMTIGESTEGSSSSFMCVSWEGAPSLVLGSATLGLNVRCLCGGLNWILCTRNRSSSSTSITKSCTSPSISYFHSHVCSSSSLIGHV